MIQSQLVRLITTLSPKEIESFDKFLRSPYFNTHQDTLRLFEILKDLYPDFDVQNIKKEKVFNQIFPERAYKDEQLRTLRKYLLQQLNHFIALQVWENDQVAIQLSLMEGLEKKEDGKFWEKQYQKGKQLAESNEKEGFYFFLQSYNLERSYLNFQFFNNKRKAMPDAANLHQYLDWFYLGTKLMLLASSLNNYLVIKHERQEYPMEWEAFTNVGQKLESFPDLIKAYYWACKILNEPREDHEEFTLLKDVLERSHTHFLSSDKINLYGFLITYSNQRYLLGNEKFLEEMFFIYRGMLEKDLLFIGSMFPANNFKNIVTLGLRTGHLDWTESFIEKYKEFLPDPYKDDVYSYNLAHLLLYKKEHSDALKILQLINFLDPFYQIGAKILQIKIHYEETDEEQFFLLAKTFQNHIRRQKEVPEARKEAFGNFVKLSRKLFKIKIGERPYQEKMKEELMGIKPLAELDWLRKKLDELEIQ
ncbi:MAG: hypothetical protein MRZ79_10005 [Bacteroidia bacterium]|nr:hypothetical protein [Bacteroidia bacterium]